MNPAKKTLKISILSMLVAFSLLISSSWAQRLNNWPDMILYNGQVLTMDDDFRIADALALRNDQIQAVGSSSEILELSGSNTNQIDLKGKTVIPGFTDSHFHLLSSGLAFQKLQLTSAINISELVDIIAQAAQDTPKGNWIVASRNWTLGQLEENRLPTRQELDQATTEHPVWVPRGGHRGVANSLGLQLAGLTNMSQAPTGGEIGKDEKGELTGFLLDTAQNPIRKIIPQPTHQDRVQAILSMQSQLNAAGITSVILGAAFPDEIKLLQEIREAGKLTLRITARMRVRTVEGYDAIKAMPRSGFGDSWLKIGTIKMGVDGGSDGNMFTEPYVNRPDFYGIQVTPTETLRQVVLEGNRQGWNFSFHCNGDRAFDVLLPILEDANKEKVITARRWTIEHGRYPRSDHIRSLKSLGVLFSVQANPYWLSSVHIAGFGLQRASYGNPLRQLIDSGVHVASGSDHGIYFSPLLHMSVYVTRQTRDSGILGIEHAISAQEALSLVTKNPPHLTFEESIKGTIEPGKLADLAILSSGPLTVSPSEIKDIEVIATLVGGEVISGNLEE
jgi:predicted amidohydrolase YtcJ